MNYSHCKDCECDEQYSSHLKPCHICDSQLCDSHRLHCDKCHGVYCGLCLRDKHFCISEQDIFENLEPTFYKFK